VNFAIVFHTIWALVTSSMVYVVYDFDNFFRKNLEPLATLLEKEGVVKVRFADLNLWHLTDDNQLFYRNEIVATHDESLAIVTFDGENVLMLEENSQLLVQESKESEDFPVLVTLFSGKIKTINLSKAPKTAKEKALRKRLRTKLKTYKEKKQEVKKPAAKKKTKPLAIKAGSQVIALKSNETQLSIAKDAGEESAAIQVETGSVEVKNEKSGKVEVAKEGFKSKPPPKPKPIIADAYLHPKLSLLPQVIWPKPDVTYWTTRNLNSSIEIPVKLALTDDFKEAAPKWVSLLQIQGNANESLFESKRIAPSVTIRVPFTSSLKIATGYKLSEKIKSKIKYPPFIQNESHPLKIESLRPLQKTSVKLAFNALNFQAKRGNWIEQIAELEEDEGTYSLQLAPGPFLSKLKPLLQNNKKFTLQKKEITFAGEGIFALGKKNIIAQIESEELKSIRDTAKALTRTIGASVLFKGSTDDILMLAGKHYKGKNWLQNEDLEDVFFLQNGKLVSINRSLLQKQKDALRLVNSRSHVIFAKKVEILASQQLK
jgi:hypothetical protein